MSHQTVSATKPDAVLIETRAGGTCSDVWLRKNIERDVADMGPDAGKAVEFYRADEVHFVQAGVPAVDEVVAAFAALWAAHEHDELTDAERIAALEQANADTAAALMELGDLMGGE